MEARIFAPIQTDSVAYPDSSSRASRFLSLHPFWVFKTCPRVSFTYLSLSHLSSVLNIKLFYPAETLLTAYKTIRCPRRTSQHELHACRIIYLSLLRGEFFSIRNFMTRLRVCRISIPPEVVCLTFRTVGKVPFLQPTLTKVSLLTIAEGP